MIIIIIIITLFLGRHYHCLPTDLTLAVQIKKFFCVISDFRREAEENCALQGHYAASCGTFLPTFRDNLSVPSSAVEDPKDCPETSASSYHYSLRNDADQRSSHEAPHYAFLSSLLSLPVLQAEALPAAAFPQAPSDYVPPQLHTLRASNCRT
jgi:hypothetical protein